MKTSRQAEARQGKRQAKRQSRPGQSFKRVDDTRKRAAEVAAVREHVRRDAEPERTGGGGRRPRINKVHVWPEDQVYGG